MSIRLLRLCGWLLCLILPVSAMAIQPLPGMPGYYPGQVTAQPPPAGTPPGVQPVVPVGVPGYYTAPMANPYYPYPAPRPVPGIYGRPRPGQSPYVAPRPWSYPSVPAAPGYQPQQQKPVQASRPYIETRVESTSAYVHQNLVMTIQVISAVNLKTAAAQLQDTDDVIFRQLGDPTVSTRTLRGQQEIVNTLYYQLTPLRSGSIELEPVHVTGNMEGGSQHEIAYDAVANQPLHLTVSDPDPSVQPWLPLHELELSATLSHDEQIGEGEPLTLIIEQRAVGMSGAQLPSFEDRLQAPGHRLYREKSEYQGTISKQGTLIGSRIDRFTLVPQQGNRVEIPAIRVDWWNVDRHRRETAVLPGRLLNDRGRQPGEESQADGREPGGFAASWLMWPGLLAIAFVLGRYWTIVSPGLRRASDWFWLRLETGSRPLRRRLAKLLVRLSPQRNLHLLRRKVADSLPRSARLWFCVRSADEEQDADDWSQVLRFLVNRRLGLQAYLPMSKLAEHIIEIHPGADPDKIRALLGELEAALFSDHSIRDFDAWKQEFKQQVRPRFFAGLRRRQRDRRANSLPGLNPTVA